MIGGLNLEKGKDKDKGKGREDRKGYNRRGKSIIDY